MSLALEHELDRIEREALLQHASRVENEVQRQIELWDKHDHHDGTGGDYRILVDLYEILTADAERKGDLTWALILLKQTYKALAQNDDEEFEKRIVQVEAVIRSWVAIRARRKALSRAKSSWEAR